ncbi:hypothetical protein FHP29_11675 [Nocardioides albidus]|uniref:WD40 repeat domain-containing protein n=1 Tax=Nocardioides albidus TaxID=1517589 RepID=A0A5C4VWA5_9ACTN|nr:hypothetical protein [Nocardioides albidus]TNM39539.1 hypothetical protein FHP29_11675 [Nocardioides albidus]
MRRISLPFLMVAIAICAGCDSGSSSESVAWQHSEDPVTTAGIAFAVGSVAHLPDDEIDVGVPIATIVVAGDGVYFTEDEDPDDDTLPTSGEQELLFAGRDGDVVRTGVEVLVGTTRASPDGRYLAALDMESGEEDAFGTPQAALVVWDLAEGKEIIRSTDATGDPAEDDFADLYPELEMQISTITDDGLTLRAAGIWTYDFATGKAQEIGIGDLPPRPTSSLVNPDSPWRIDHEGTGQLLLGPDGAQVAPQADSTRLELRAWLDQDTAYGLLRGAQTEVMTCDVPSGRCEALAGTAGERVVLPNGLPISGFDLRPPQQ